RRCLGFCAPAAKKCLPMWRRVRPSQQSFGRWARPRAIRSAVRLRDRPLYTTAAGPQIASARMLPAEQCSNPVPQTLPVEYWRRAEKEIPGRRKEEAAKRSSCEATIAQPRQTGQQKQEEGAGSLRPFFLFCAVLVLLVAVCGLAGRRIQNQEVVAA